MTTHSATILIVDNQLADCELLERMLSPEGYLTLRATSGVEALAIIAKTVPDLILLDVMMPGLDGNQVTNILKADPVTSGIPIIMVTAQSERGFRLESLNAGAEDFLTKPVIRTELWLRVRNLLRLKTLGDVQKKYALLLEQRSEATVQQRDDELRALAEAMPQIIWITRYDGWNTFFNHHWLDYSGLTLEESLGHWGTLPFHPEDQERVWSAWQDATTATRAYSLEARLRRADGAYRWWLVQSVPQLDAEGGIRRWFSNATDIHDLKTAHVIFRSQDGPA
jgi:PAS domain S-box-containing protein